MNIQSTSNFRNIVSSRETYNVDKGTVETKLTGIGLNKITREQFQMIQSDGATHDKGGLRRILLWDDFNAKVCTGSGDKTIGPYGFGENNDS